MNAQLITLSEVKELVNREDRSFIGRRLSDEDRKWFADSENGEFESGDWYEHEGGRELVIDANGIILYFEGYYFDIR